MSNTRDIDNDDKNLTAIPERNPEESHMSDTREPNDPNGSVTAGSPPAVQAPGAAPKKKSRKGLWITLGVIGGLIVVSSISNAINGGSKADDVVANKPAAVAGEPVAEEKPAEAPALEVKVTVPDVVGMTASEAVAVLRGAGFKAADESEPDGTVTGMMPVAGESVVEGSTVALAVEAKPKLTIGQQNAVGKAKSYISMAGFSRSGLVEQLEFEGFATEDATFAVDNIGADWNVQAGAKAESYMKMTSFSRDGLYDQLIFEGFSDAEANAGLAAVGY